MPILGFSEVKHLLDSLLWEIYGKQRQQQQKFSQSSCSYPSACTLHSSTMTTKTRQKTSKALNFLHRPRQLHLLNERQLMDVCAILKVEIRLMSHCLERVLCMRERLCRHQEVLCEFVNTILHIEFADDAHPKMHFSLSPPLPKADFTALTSATKNNIFNITNNNNNNNNHNINNIKSNNINNFNNNNNNYQLVTSTDDEKSIMTAENEATSDYKQWLHAMKLVAHLPGGMPPEFRRKLWLSLADKYLKSKNIDWAKEEEKCFCEKWREDDEELGIQIVKDLHRTGSNLCTGPTGTINQAKLKRILLGYARYNPEVGYCQGFNMLGALILQVMDKNEFEAMKVMIYLVEGVLPLGYFHGSMRGLQADMGVFRELMQTKLPRLAKHLQKLQGPVENAYEPPLTNVFTMQWFLTLFCTCLPMSCVLRIWDLVLIEGSDVLLRTALVLWGILEDRVLDARTADDFYCKMGSFSEELLNGHLIDSNGLIEKVVILGPIPDIQRLRDKHLYNIAPLRNKPGLHLYYDGEDGETDEESRLAVATVWGVPWGRRGSTDKQAPKQQPIESRERIALDISLLKKQYDRLRERQKQAQLILTTACNTARQTATPVLTNTPNMPVNQLLMGRQAIITNRGQRIGAATKLIPPARKPSLPTVLQSTRLPDRQLRRGETLNWRDTDLTKQKRRDSLTWKEIKADRESILQEGVATKTKQSQKLHSRLGKSDSSSYSEESGAEEEGSSTDTSLCDEDDIKSADDRTLSSLEDSPKRRSKTPRRKKALLESINNNNNNNDKTQLVEKVRPKSWAPSSQEIPFILMSSDSLPQSGDEKYETQKKIAEPTSDDDLIKNKSLDETDWTEFKCSTYSENMVPIEAPYMPMTKDILKFAFEPKLLEVGVDEKIDDGTKKLNLDSNGITNQFFERVNSIERPKKLDLFYSLNEEDSIRNAYSDIGIKPISKYSSSEPSVAEKEAQELKTIFTNKEDLIIFEMEERPKLSNSKHVISFNSPDILRDTMRTKIVPGENISNNLKREENDNESNKKKTLDRLKNKRRDPRRMTLTRSSTFDIEERYKALEQTDILETYEKRDIRQNRQSIPSTADLEKRYNILEKQLSGSDSKVTRQENSNDVPLSTPTILIPEKLFTSISKEISSTDINKTLNDANGSKETKEKPNNSPMKQNEDTKQKHQGKEESGSKTAEMQTSGRKAEESRKEDERPRLKKLPSTAELEDRFNALERRLSTQKSPSKAKKEPPDGSESSEQHKDESNAQERKTNTHKEIDNSTEKKTKNSEPISRKEVNTLEKTISSKTDDKMVDIKKNETLKDDPKAEKIDPHDIRNSQNSDSQEGRHDSRNIETKENNKTNIKLQQSNEHEARKIELDDKELQYQAETNTSPPDKEKSNQRKNEIEELNKSPEHKPTIQRKTPPTTEELESRYQAIEKQLSVNRIEIEYTDIEETDKEIADRKSLKNGQNQKTARKVNSNEQVQEKETVKSNDAKQEPVNSIDKKEERINDHEKRKLKAEEFIDGPNKRRGSEPPSTEDLEKRFEMLKRRMSSRAIAEKTLTKAEMLAKYSKRLECDKLKESLDEEESLNRTAMEEVYLKDDLIRKYEKDNEMIRQAGSSHKPPTTEDLENRFEALQLQRETKTPKKTKDTNIEKVSALNDRKTAKTKTISKSKTECFEDETSFEIPIAPPLPMSHNTEALNLIIPIASGRSLQRALVEELRSKIKTSPDGSNLKPSDINPNRKTFKINRANQNKAIDGTSESHAKNAPFWSENHKLWKQTKTVRRFSDLPSRADLENRLEFLERQLYQKFKKQRCASDSEVTSMKSTGAQTTKPLEIHQEIPSTSKSQPAPPHNLEERVQALEKQLSENSLKLLETVRQITHDQITTQDVSLSRHLSTEFVDVTGKELVRYTNLGEVEDAESHKPFNINIHIKMSLKNKETENEKKSEILPSTQELERRLQLLEQQIRESKLQELETGKAHNPEDTFAQQETFKKNKIVKKDEIFQKIEKLKKLESADQNKTIEKTKIDEKKEAIENEEKIEKKANIEKKEAPEKTETIENKETFENNNLECRTPTEKVCSPTKYEKEITYKEETELEIPVENSRSELKTEQEITSEISSVARNEKENFEKTSIKKDDEIPKKTQDNMSISKEDKKIMRSGIEVKQTVVEGQENVAVTVKPIAAESQTTDCPKNEKQRHENTHEISEKEPTNEPITAEEVVADVCDVDPNNKTLVLLMDNEPKAVKVRRLTRANTEELEGLFQALEKQLNDRNLIKSDDGKLVHALEVNEKLRSDSQKICNLTKEIEKLTNSEKEEIKEQPKDKPKIEEKTEEKKKQEEPFDWGADPVKRHLKRKTVYLPSTKELEARFRSFERQIKFLEDVEKIDVEQRLIEIERKIKLQYSLSHEKDLNKFLELCDGKEIDGPETTNSVQSKEEDRSRSPKSTRAQRHSRTPQSSPARKSKRSPYQSPVRTRVYESPYTSPARSNQHSPYTSPVRSKKQSPYTSPLRSQTFDDSHIPSTEDLEYRFRALELKRPSDHYEKSKKDTMLKKQPIHPLEMLLDPSPDDSNIPTTGELEHRMRIMDKKREKSTSPKTKRSKSPKYPRAIESPDMSPNYNREPPTAEELEARVQALEEDHCFDFKTQKTYKEFNQKLKDAISPSFSFEEFPGNKSREQSPKRKSALRDSEYDTRPSDHALRSTSPKVIRFAEDEFDEENSHFYEKTVGNSNEVIEMIEENSKILHRILKKTFTDSNSSIYSTLAAAEGLEARGARLLRETSPMRRTGTHTGVSLRTDLNINDRLDSIKNTIKSIDHLCEEKPYKKEKCQRYIDSLFTNSVHFTKKSSLEYLRRKNYGPSIHVSDHCERLSARTIGSAESIRSTSPLRAASPPHHRSNRELRREISPRRRRDEDLEELESRVRRGNILPKSYFLDNSNVSKDNSLTQFHKVDRQLDQYKYDDERYLSNSRPTSRSPLRSPYGSTDMMMHNLTTTTPTKTFPTISSRLDFDRPHRTPSNNLSGYEFFKRPSNSSPVYNPGKLEIRHTTVTSTFYDRLLAEKQIEKTLTRTSKKSPVVSPSITSRSYTDLPQASEKHPLLSPNKKYPTTLNNHFQLNGIPRTLSPGHTDASITSSFTATTSANTSLAAHHHLPFSYTNPLPYTTTSNLSNISLVTTQNQINDLTSLNSSSLLPNSPKIFSSTVISTTSTLGNSLVSVSTYSPISHYTDVPSQTKSHADGSVNSINSSTTFASTGVYNPVMPFIMRQPQDAATITSLNVLEHNLSTAITSISPTKRNANFPKL